MQPPKEVIQQALSGRMIVPVGKQGKFWTIYRRPAHQCFTGQQVWELVSPTGQEWIVDRTLSDMTILVYSA